MSRDFKDEYEEYLNKETPDLWSRIEASLPEKEISKEQPKKRVIPMMYKVVPMAAALVLVVVSASAIGLHSKSDNSSEYMAEAEKSMIDDNQCENLTEESIATMQSDNPLII